MDRRDNSTSRLNSIDWHGLVCTHSLGSSAQDIVG